MSDNGRMPEGLWNEAMAAGYQSIGAGYVGAVEAATKGDGCPTALPLALGGIVALGDFLRALREDGKAMDLTEEYALAVLRGALRGEEGPVYEDGRLFLIPRGH
ncbi:hypothetical protein [Pseudoroseomonas ludipueritiae]|uniref:Uncharacterized protein n=1 Tax=Pseudoroseomonas ludipueritiae TaxID=198093 RepID=A0ABR7RCV6_9PROT|nr:hypothetical protein [Pseudoroseomonas ludipueritiae]MBC9179581.1 hypothetical protein [Pseudoroseomonas ludipueritiae]